MMTHSICRTVGTYNLIVIAGAESVQIIVTPRGSALTTVTIDTTHSQAIAALTEMIQTLSDSQTDNRLRRSQKTGEHPSTEGQPPKF